MSAAAHTLSRANRGQTTPQGHASRASAGPLLEGVTGRGMER